jgi:hypothetical protein
MGTKFPCTCLVSGTVRNRHAPPHPHLKCTAQVGETARFGKFPLVRTFKFGGSPLEQAPEEDFTQWALKSNGRLAGSKNPFERLVGTLWVTGMLEKRLRQLTDRQMRIGRVAPAVDRDQIVRDRRSGMLLT